MEKKICFFIAPFEELESTCTKRTNQIWNHIITPAVSDCGYIPIRSDQVSETGTITSNVIRHIMEDPIVIADLTEQNHFVFYHLALRHETKKPVVQIIMEGEQIPIYVAGVKTIQVDHHDLDSVTKAKEEIVNQIKSFESSSFELETPVSDVYDLINFRKIYNLEKSVISEVRESIEPLNERLESIQKYSESLKSLEKEMQKLYPYFREMFEKGKSTETSTSMSQKEYNFFISYASEDKIEVGLLLATRLIEKGYKVWIDEFELTIGDNLFGTISQGMANSQYGIVILSHNYFNKEWPKKELEGFVAREDGSGKVILPIWHNIDKAQVSNFSPILAGKKAADTRNGIDNVVDQILKAYHKDLNKKPIPNISNNITKEKEKIPHKPIYNPNDKPRKNYGQPNQEVRQNATFWGKNYNAGRDIIINIKKSKLGTIFISILVVLLVFFIAVIFWPTPEMVKIPGSHYFSGENRIKNFLSTFWLDTTPVTNQEYKIFVEATGHAAPKHWLNGTFLDESKNHPVVNVSLADAEAYAAWAKKRLPSKEEWEKACRGERGNVYPWGDSWETGISNTEETGLGKTSPAGYFSRNKSPYGCLDMIGNVWEWTGTPDTTNPGFYYIMGGAFNQSKSVAKCYDARSLPGAMVMNNIGFRCANETGSK